MNNNDQLDVAILLIYAAERAITKQKTIEALCAYPIEYGVDPFILVQMQAFLNIKEVKERLEVLKKNQKTK